MRRRARAIRTADLVVLAVSALRQQMVRTLLSLLGVAIGTYSLALSLSVGHGVESAFIRQLRENDQLRKIYVSASFQADTGDVPKDTLDVKGTMSAARRARLREAIVARWNREHFTTPSAVLTAKQMASLGRIPHVRDVIPAFRQSGRAILQGTPKPVIMATADTGEPGLRGRIVAGRLYSSPSERTVVVHEYLLYIMGLRNEVDVSSAIGRTIRLEYGTGRRSRYPVLSMLTAGRVKPDAPEHLALERLVSRLWPMLGHASLDSGERAVGKLVLQSLTPPDDPYQDPPVAEEFTIIGVMRGTTKSDPSSGVEAAWVSRQADILIPYATAQEYFFRAPWNADQGAEAATLRVDNEESVKAVADAVRHRGFYEYSLVAVIDRFRENVLLVTLALAFIAAVALIVSALGITNTMLMGVLERTREIGVMKAVGARDRHIQIVFLIEGASIGLVGGLLGVLLSWLTKFPGDAIARAIIAKQTHSPPSASVFVFPLIVTAGVPLLACVITTLAAVFPSRRALRVDPVTALRHE